MNVDSAEFNSISLFAGGAGLDMGLELANISRRVVAFVEREAFAVELLASRMDAGLLDPAPIWSDVTTFDARPFRGLVGVVSGGFPCQDISNAGTRAGITGKRSGLWSEFARIIDESRPGLVAIENVAALRSRGLEVVLSDLAALGFNAEWGTFRAADVGATHARDRLFVLAYRDRRRLESVGRGWLREDQQVDRQGAERGNDAFRSSRSNVADGGGEGLEGHGEPRRIRSQEPVFDPSRLDLTFPPGPDEFDKWRAIVAQRPDLEPSVRRVAHGLADRVDRLRLTGNGVVPAQAAEAYFQLARRALTDP